MGDPQAVMRLTATAHQQPTRTGSSRSMRASEAGAGFYFAHVALVALFLAYTLLRTRGGYLGASVEEVPNVLRVLLLHFLWRTLLPPLALAFIIGPLAGLIAAPCVTFRRRPLVVGIITYLALSSTLLVTAPAAFTQLPLLDQWPIGISLFISAAAPVALAAWLFGRVHRGRALAWLALLVVCAVMPHDTVRAVVSAFKPTLPAETPRLLVFVIDALRYDTACEATPQALNVQAGVSHFGSTRKQYRLLMSGDRLAVERAMFIPTRNELNTQVTDSLLSERVKRSGRRMAFLIDDPLTASAANIGIVPNTFAAPSRGIQDALLSGTWMIPVASWLWNVAGAVEGVNPWSDYATYLRDVARAVDRHEVVVAHTVWLQHPPYRYRELALAGGSRWWSRPAGSLALRTERAPPGDTLFADGRRAYQARVATLVPATITWLQAEASQRPLATVLTADHGQEFVESERAGVYYNGIHGWSISPPTMWIPFVPVARTTLASHEGAWPTWLDLRTGIINWLVHSDTLRIEADQTPIDLMMPFISVTQYDSAGQRPPPENMLTPARIARAIRMDWTVGWFLADSISVQYSARSAGRLVGTHLSVTDPDRGGGRVIADWDGYQRRDAERASPHDPQGRCVPQSANMPQR